MSFSLQAAVVGTGFIGPVHVEALRRAGVTVRGILGSSEAKSKRAAETLGLEHGYESLDLLLGDDSVDVVHLTTPNRFHFEQAKAALQAGKHVLCEKPLAMNTAETAELVRIAEASGLAAGVAYNIRFYPLCHHAAAAVADPSWGDTLHVTGSYVQDWLLHDTDFNWRVLADEGGELRAVADIGTHWLDLVQFICGRPVVAVCADLQRVYDRRKRPLGGSETFTGSAAAERSTEEVDVTTEDAGCILLRFAGGARGSLHVSQMTAGRKNCLRWEIAGSQTAMAWNSEQPNMLWKGHRGSPNEQIIRDPAGMASSAAAISQYPAGHNEGFPDTFKQLFRTFYGYIAAGDFSAIPTFPTFADGHREVALCEAILASHREQKWVEVDGNPKS